MNELSLKNSNISAFQKILRISFFIEHLLWLPFRDSTSLIRELLMINEKQKQ